MAKRPDRENRASHKRVRRDAEHDVDLSVIDFNTADQGADDLASGEPVGGFEPMLHLRGEVLQTTNHQPEFAAYCITEEADRAVIDATTALAWTAIAWFAARYSH